MPLPDTIPGDGAIQLRELSLTGGHDKSGAPGSADLVCVTKGDLVSQAEREVYRHRIRQMNARAVIRHVNGLTGQGCQDLSRILALAPEAGESLTDRKLRFAMPAAVCSYCLSEMRIGGRYQKGNVKKAVFAQSHGTQLLDNAPGETEDGDVPS